MNKKYFVDGCILMNYFMGRSGCEYAEMVLALSQQGKIECFTSSLVICTTAYLFEKYKVFAKKEIPNVINSLIDIVKVLPVTDKHISEAVYKSGIDFEDNVQISCAEEFCDAIITDNIKDFKNTTLPVQTPKEVIDIHS